MTLTHPLQFEPLFMERAWGGRRLETLYGKPLPPGERIGESWEVVDRDEAQSVVHSGILKGKTLRELWAEYRDPVFGPRYRDRQGPFPILIKLLDAEERLSVQVHPPQPVATTLQGEPKDEIWFITDSTPDADLFVGLRHGTTREAFEKALEEGSVADLLHRLPCSPGESIFIPSGRIHAIGAGNVIIEVQQNSDTTYRVFDWNRTGLDGKPRELHIEASRQSINFNDFEPSFLPKERNPLVSCPFFQVEKLRAAASETEAHQAREFAIITPLDGVLECAGQRFAPGQFFLLPAQQEDRKIATIDTAPVEYLKITLP